MWADPNIIDTNGNTILHQISNIHIIKLIVHHGGNVNIQNNNGETPLLMASKRGDKGMIECLMKMEANPEIANNKGIHLKQ